MSEPALCASLHNCQKSKTVRFVGTWRLAPQRAMSLWPRRSSQILIVQGSAWITWFGTRHGSQPLAGLSGDDHFLQAGQILDVPGGAHLVMESRHPGQSVHFDWRELPAPQAVQGVGERALAELGLQWLQALRQLGWATAQLVRALGRLARIGRLTGRVTSHPAARVLA